MCVLFCLGTWTPEAHQGGRTSAACTQRGLFRHACCAPRPVALASAGRLAATHTPRSPPTPTPSPTPTPPLPAHPPTYTPHPPTTHTHTYTAPTHTQSTHPRMRTHTRACSPYLTICPPLPLFPLHTAAPSIPPPATPLPAPFFYFVRTCAMCVPPCISGPRHSAQCLASSCLLQDISVALPPTSHCLCSFQSVLHAAVPRFP